MARVDTQRGVVTSRRRAPAEKRKRILAAARRIFSQKRYEETFVGEIADAAGVSEGIVFHHFGSKKDLCLRLAEQYAEEAAEAALQMADDRFDLDGTVRRAFDFADKDPVLYRMFIEGEPGFEDQRFSVARTHMVDVFAEFIHRHVDAGRVRPCNPKIMAELQLAMVIGAYRGWRGTDDAALRDAYINQAVQCLKDTLIPRGVETAE